MKFIPALLCAFSILCGSASAELRLGGLFGDHMVLQRELPVPIWGWAAAGENVTVEFAGQKKTGTADSTGKWMVRLDPMPASAESRTLTVTGSSSITKNDVLVGDVWLCSGQSNMGIPMSVPGNDCLQRKIHEANHPQLRLIQVLHQFPNQPVLDTKGAWRLAQPDAVQGWPAISYLFGEQIQTELGVPVGIIVAAMGGTPIESWMSHDVLQANPANTGYLKNYEQALRQLPESLANYEKELAAFKQRFPDEQSLASENSARRGRGEPVLQEPQKPKIGPNSPRNPAACFNGKIAPIVPFAIRGVLWYQGEGNVLHFDKYSSQMADLMRQWRELFELPELPFFMTELAPLGQPAARPEDSARARFGEALAKTSKADGNAWVITIVDGGDPDNIHPAKKEIPAGRFAAMALAKVYGRPGIAHGPLLASWETDNGKAIVRFESVGGGLVSRTVNLGGHEVGGGVVQGFELAGADRRFFPASARIAGSDTIVVSSPDVPTPVAVRYAWAGFPLCNLYNQEGFAAYPFRTDDWPFQPATQSSKP